MDWHLFDLCLSSGDVALRSVTDPDPPAIAAMFPDDDEQYPRWEHSPAFGSAEPCVLLLRRTWHHRGSWSPSSWCLDLAAEVSGELVRLQALRADDFAKLRTVDSGSWLTARARSRGVSFRDPESGQRKQQCLSITARGSLQLTAWEPTACRGHEPQVTTPPRSSDTSQ
jgi:hypothetical protein